MEPVTSSSNAAKGKSKIIIWILSIMGGCLLLGCLLGGIGLIIYGDSQSNNSAAMPSTQQSEASPTIEATTPTNIARRSLGISTSSVISELSQKGFIFTHKMSENPDYKGYPEAMGECYSACSTVYLTGTTDELVELTFTSPLGVGLRRCTTDYARGRVADITVGLLVDIFPKQLQFEPAKAWLFKEMNTSVDNLNRDYDAKTIIDGITVEYKYEARWNSFFLIIYRE